MPGMNVNKAKHTARIRVISWKFLVFSLASIATNRVRSSVRSRR